MKECVIISKEDWQRLPLLIADELERQARKEWGFKVVNREDDLEIQERLRDYLAAQMATIWPDVVKRLKSQ